MQSGKIVVEHLYKVFGSNPQEAIDLLKEGWSKDKILAEKGAVIGVSDVSFSVEEGEIFVLMGLSGSGKSTLIRLINRLVEPSAGDVFIDGQNVAKLPQSQLIDLRRRDMSMVFQSFALMPSRSVLDNAAFGLEVAGTGRKEREKRAMEVLKQVGLDTAIAHGMLTMGLGGGYVTDWVGDPAAVTEYNVRFTAVVPVPNDGVGAEIVFNGRVKSVEPENKSVTIALSATTGGKKIFGRAIAVAKLA